MSYALPSVLTESDWNKKKGIIAKMAGETGIGAQLKKVETTYEKVDWTVFDAKAVSKTVQSKDDVDKAILTAKKVYSSDVEKHRAELSKLRDLASKAALSFKKNKLIPKASVEVAEAISSSADRFFVQLKSMDSEFKALEAVKDDIKQSKVEDVVGAGWFATVKKIQLIKNGMVKAFATDPSFTLNVMTNEPDAKLVEFQKGFKAEATVFSTTYQKILSLEGKTMKTKDITKVVPELWNILGDSFMVMKPGMRGYLGMWTDRQSTLSKEDPKVLKEFLVFHQVGKLGQFFQSEEAFINQAQAVTDKL